MAKVILKFKSTKTTELTFDRELTEEEIDAIEKGTFNPDEYDDYGDKESEDVHYNDFDNFELDFDQMEFGEGDDYEIIYSTQDMDDYKSYIKKEEDPEYIRPHGSSLF